MSEERRQVAEFLKAEPLGKTPKEIARAVGAKDVNIQKLLSKMLNDGVTAGDTGVVTFHRR